MYRVLMAVDENEDRLRKQLDAIRDLPGREDLAVTVLYVYEEVDVQPDEAGSRVIDSINEDIEELQGVPETLAQAQDALEEMGVAVDVRTGKGDDPASVILDVASDIDADAVSVAARARSPVGKAMFGSVTQKVILEGERPVLVAR